jgi:DUF4097 and DUF4098 domain-containing protein YvlB
MGTQRFEPVERIELGQADGDVAIKGWEEAAIEVTVDGDESECSVEVQDDVLLVSCRAPLALQVPRGTVLELGEVSGELLVSDLDRAVSVGTVRGDALVSRGSASVSVQAVHGDLGVERLEGPFSVTELHGDLHLKHISAARVGSVHGDVYARDVAAEIDLGAVSGEVRLRDVAGAVTLEEVQGDFRGRELLGGLTANQVHGSLSLKTALTPGATYRARAQGDVTARFPAEASARLTLSAQGDLSVKGFEVAEQEAGQFEGQVGEGEATVVLEAGGSLSAKVRGAEDEREHVWGFSMEALGAEIEAEIAAHMDEFDADKIAAREIERAMRQVEREIERAQERAQRAAERAQERAHRAEERARKAQEKALKRAKKFQAKVDLDWQPRDRGRSRARRAPRGPSSEEQATILSMLQAGTITVEEAEQLLNALASQG